MDAMFTDFFIRLLDTELSLDFVPEYKFCKDRRWRFDFACVEKKIAIEFEGINFNGKSRHRTGTGYLKDMEKYNCATLMGWHVLRYTENPYNVCLAVYYHNVVKDIFRLLKGEKV